MGGVGEHLRDLLGRVGDSDLKLDADEVPPEAVAEGHAFADGGVGDVRAPSGRAINK